MRRLAHRLRPRWTHPLALAGAIGLTLFWAGVIVLVARDPGLKPHQRQMALILGGAFGLVCVIGLARLLAAALVARATHVEVSVQPARRGETLRCFVVQAGAKEVDVRLQCLREARGSPDVIADLPVGRAGAMGLRAQLEADVLLPADAPASELFKIRWRLRVAASFEAVPDVVRDFPLSVA